MGDASSVRIAIAPEATFGVNPGAGFDFLRFNSEALKLARGFVQSGEIDANRQPAGQVPINKAAEGPINVESSLVTPVDIASPGGATRGFDLLYASAYMNDWTTIINNAEPDVSITSVVGGTFDLIDNDVSSDAFADVVAGQWIEVSGFGTNSTIYAHVLAKNSDADLSCEGVRSNGDAVTAEANQAVTVKGSMLRIGNVKRSVAIEKQRTDLSPVEFSLYTGMRVQSWQRTTNPQGIISEVFQFDGKLQDTTQATSTGGSETVKWATPRLNAVDHINWIMEGAFTGITSDRVAEIAHTLNNQTRRDFAIGEQGPPDIGIGTPTLDGSFNVFMQNADLIRLYEDQNLTKLAYLLDDGTRRQLVSFKRVRITDATDPAQGNDQTVQAQASWSAEADSAGISGQIDRF